MLLERHQRSIPQVGRHSLVATFLAGQRNGKGIAHEISACKQGMEGIEQISSKTDGVSVGHRHLTGQRLLAGGGKQAGIVGLEQVKL